MSLNSRVRKPEAAACARECRPCRRYGPLVIYPATLPTDENGRAILPRCEAPATCPGVTDGQANLPERRPG